MRIVLAVLLASFLGCQKEAGQSSPAPGTTATPASAVSKVISVGVSELRLAYGAEPTAAAEKFTGKKVRVMCPSHSQIIQDQNKAYYIHANLFEGDRRMVAIVFRLAPTSFKLVEGVAMTSPKWELLGTVRGVDADPARPGDKAVIIDECDIYQVKESSPLPANPKPQ